METRETVQTMFRKSPSLSCWVRPKGRHACEGPLDLVETRETVLEEAEKWRENDEKHAVNFFKFVVRSRLLWQYRGEFF